MSLVNSEGDSRSPDELSEYNVEHREYYKKVMKELKSVFTCHLCNTISIEGLRYRYEYDTSIIYCSTRCRNIRGWIGSGNIKRKPLHY
jgi:hypothetical protein